jgi:predicted transcriptional regulator
MTVITLPPTLMQQLEQIAVEQTTSSAALLETAVRAYLRQVERDQIKAEANTFRALHAELVASYLGQYVAMRHGQIVDYDLRFRDLHTRVRQRFGRQPVLIRRVEERPERELIFRSPRVERTNNES